MKPYRRFFVSSVALALVSVFGLVACGSKSSSSSSTSTTAATAAMTTISSKINSAALLKSGQSLYRRNATGASMRLAAPPTHSAGAFGSEWSGDTTAAGSNVTLKDWMGDQINPADRDSVFGRFAALRTHVCYIDHMLAQYVDATGYPANATYSNLSFSTTAGSAYVTDCSPSTQEMNQTFGATITVADAGGAIYQKMLSLRVSQNGQAQPAFVYYIYHSGGVIRVMAWEPNSDHPTQSVSRSIASYDPTTKVTLFEFDNDDFTTNGGSTRGYQINRMFIDENAGAAQIATMHDIYDTGSSSWFYSDYVLTGSLAGTGTLALSMNFNLQNAGPGAPGQYQACVNPTTGNIVTDNSLACGQTGSDAQTADTAVHNAISGYTSVSSYTHDATQGVPFTTQANMLTASP